MAKKATRGLFPGVSLEELRGMEKLVKALIQIAEGELLLPDNQELENLIKSGENNGTSSGANGIFQGGNFNGMERTDTASENDNTSAELAETTNEKIKRTASRRRFPLKLKQASPSLVLSLPSAVPKIVKRAKRGSSVKTPHSSKPLSSYNSWLRENYRRIADETSNSEDTNKEVSKQWKEYKEENKVVIRSHKKIIKSSEED